MDPGNPRTKALWPTPIIPTLPISNLQIVKSDE
jgi:hypothetical protein